MKKTISSPTPPTLVSQMSDDYATNSQTAANLQESIMIDFIAAINKVERSLPADSSLVIMDIGCANGKNSEKLMANAITTIHEINPNRKIKIIYIDQAPKSEWVTNMTAPESLLHTAFQAQKEAKPDRKIELEYHEQSFYVAIPELLQTTHVIYSSTAIHWQNLATASPKFYINEKFAQPNQMPPEEKAKYIAKWQTDWTLLFHNLQQYLAPKGQMVIAALSDLGNHNWPASHGYDAMCDARNRLGIKPFVFPDYFPTIPELTNFFKTKAPQFDVTITPVTVACAYKDAPAETKATQLTTVVRGWSEWVVSGEVGKQVVDPFFEQTKICFESHPERDGLPYQYAIIIIHQRSK